MANCSNCGTGLGGQFCATCGMDNEKSIGPRGPSALERAHLLRSSSSGQRHGVPALLSFFIPGLGQLVKGDVLTAVLVFAGGVFGALLCVAGAGFFVLPIVWIWNIYDAYVAPDGPTKRELKRLSNLAVIVACALALVGCGTVTADPPADGGTGGAGGKVAAAGSGGAAGAPATGNGGAGLAGASGTGGTPNGTGGAAGNSTGPIVGIPVATFDANASGFLLNNYPDTNQINLNDPAKIDSLMEMPTIGWSGINGSPSPGSLQIVAPYSGASQYVDIRSPDFPGTALQDWSGGTLHVRIKVISGTFSGDVQMYVDTGTTYSFGGTYAAWDNSSDWQEFTLNITSPMSFGDQTTYDPTQIITYGIQLNTGSAGTAAKPVTFLIDSFSIAGG